MKGEEARVLGPPPSKQKAPGGVGGGERGPGALACASASRPVGLALGEYIGVESLEPSHGFTASLFINLKQVQ